ncbi:MAG: hypothetical protein ACFFFB_11885 [Candidatus Heimdallarchaeota archaeon]
MKGLYELGIVFRGFVLVNYTSEIFDEKGDASQGNKDLRGAFISAIDTFAKNAFNNLALEYLESDNILFIFKASEIKTSDYHEPEPIILYGLIDKKKRDTDKIVKKFLDKFEIILQMFISRFQSKDFTELSQFHSFKKEIENFFI